jgi:hypothetical protein
MLVEVVARRVAVAAAQPLAMRRSCVVQFAQLDCIIDSLLCERASTPISNRYDPEACRVKWFAPAKQFDVFGCDQTCHEEPHLPNTLSAMNR